MDIWEEKISNGVTDDSYLHVMCVILFIMLNEAAKIKCQDKKSVCRKILSIHTVYLVPYAGNMRLIEVMIMIQKIFKICETVLSLLRVSGLFQKHFFMTGNFAVFDCALRCN